MDQHQELVAALQAQVNAIASLTQAVGELASSNRELVACMAGQEGDEADELPMRDLAGRRV